MSYGRLMLCALVVLIGCESCNIPRSKPAVEAPSKGSRIKEGPLERIPNVLVPKRTCSDASTATLADSITPAVVVIFLSEPVGMINQLNAMRGLYGDTVTCCAMNKVLEIIRSTAESPLKTRALFRARFYKEDICLAANPPEKRLYSMLD